MACMTEPSTVISHSYQMFYYTHKPSPIQQNTDKVNCINQKSNINLDIEENSPFQEGIISETI